MLELQVQSEIARSTGGFLSQPGFYRVQFGLAEAGRSMPPSRAAPMRVKASNLAPKRVSLI